MTPEEKARDEFADREYLGTSSLQAARYVACKAGWNAHAAWAKAQESADANKFSFASLQEAEDFEILLQKTLSEAGIDIGESSYDGIITLINQRDEATSKAAASSSGEAGDEDMKALIPFLELEHPLWNNKQDIKQGSFLAGRASLREEMEAFRNEAADKIFRKDAENSQLRQEYATQVAALRAETEELRETIRRLAK